ncbi:MAG: hypothetical protein AAF228_11460 [Pseudomonadota bacterium]
MSEEHGFIPIGVEVNKIISRVLANHSGDNQKVEFKASKCESSNDNVEAYEWQDAEQLNLFKQAVAN